MSQAEGKPVDTTAEIVNLVPIPRRKSTHGMFRTGENRISRLDVSRDLTESSKDYMVQKIQEELSGLAPTATNDIQALRKTVLHLGEIISKNTGQRIAAKTNEQSQIESDEDEPVRTIWSSILWDNDTYRWIDSGEADPYDPKLSYSGTGGTGHIEILGDGKATIIDGVVPTIWIGQSNYNSTFTANVNVSSQVYGIDINVRNRETAACQFAGYETLFDWGDNAVYFFKKPVAGISGDALSFVDLDTLGITLAYDTDTWIRTKIEGRPDTNVRISAYLMKDGAWQLVSSYVDTDANDEIGTLDAGETTIFNDCAASGDMITSSVANMIKPWRKSGQQCRILAFAVPTSNAIPSWVINSIEITSP